MKKIIFAIICLLFINSAANAARVHICYTANGGSPHCINVDAAGGCSGIYPGAGTTITSCWPFITVSGSQPDNTSLQIVNAGVNSLVFVSEDCGVSEYFGYVQNESNTLGINYVDETKTYNVNGNTYVFHFENNIPEYIMRVAGTQPDPIPFTLSPNPTSDISVVNITDDVFSSSSSFSIQISTLFGENVTFMPAITQQKTEINCSNFLRGFYLISLYKDNNTFVGQSILDVEH